MMSPPLEMLRSGLAALEQQHYSTAIDLLERYCQNSVAPESKEYLRAQMGLAKAYQRSGQSQTATAICQTLAASPHPQVQTWAKQALKSLSVTQAAPVAASSGSSTIAQTTSRTLSQATTQTITEPAIELLQSGGEALKQKRYAEAVQALETYCQQVAQADKTDAQAQIWLVKAYKGNQQTDEAIALCQQLTTAEDQMVQSWAQQYLTALSTATVVQALLQSKQAQAASAASEQPAIAKLKSLSELKSFYQRHLINDLKQIELKRKEILQKILVATAVLGVLSIFAASLRATLGLNSLFYLAIVILCFTIWVGMYSFYTSEYAKLFKSRRIVERIVQGIDENLRYSPYGSAFNTRDAFRECQLFKHLALPDRFHEDDSIIGKLGETNICCSEICAEVVNLHRDRELQVDLIAGAVFVARKLVTGQRLLFSDFTDLVFNNVSYTTLFKGMFFAADFNKTFQHRTVVVPDLAERFLGGLGTQLQSLNKQRGQLIKLEDPEFERLFAVYGDDQIEARYILSTSLMERLVKFRKKSGRDISVSFVNNTIYVAIAYDEDLFEPKLFNSMLDFQPIQEYFENLQLVIGIVQDLNLNRRIWAR
jgi:Protein of unknown function (DUF3137)